ncbi:hypothetical protein [Paenibacillus sp. N3.4]|uniref:hypothetical protein n=1 Tax=Paenibacillus sp. N3.4 TaxID=2603222 RepID=UPI0011CC5A8A|nr:hypothetical protein [Paenibacillus sp. N3.4]TXK79823.1 hypothetical protein FU659_19220 [Paenibacillus sp. N3.4]
MRTIYENYRGFKICKQESTYQAINTDRIVFTQWPLSEVLDSIDTYVDLSEFQSSKDTQSGLPQN